MDMVQLTPGTFDPRGIPGLTSPSGPRGSRASDADQPAVLVTVRGAQKQRTASTYKADGSVDREDEPPEERTEALGRPRDLEGEPLSDEEFRQLQSMQTRDREVRSHEQAHKAVGGQYAGAISYDYQRGPDGKQYAVGGEVSIDISEVEGDPSRTIAKMQQVRRAALAPAQPSTQDRLVAAEAAKKEMQARVELQEQRTEKKKEETASRTSTADEGMAKTQQEQAGDKSDTTSPDLQRRVDKFLQGYEKVAGRALDALA